MHISQQNQILVQLQNPEAVGLPGESVRPLAGSRGARPAVRTSCSNAALARYRASEIAAPCMWRRANYYYKRGKLSFCAHNRLQPTESSYKGRHKAHLAIRTPTRVAVHPCARKTHQAKSYLAADGASFKVRPTQTGRTARLIGRCDAR